MDIPLLCARLDFRSLHATYGVNHIEERIRIAAAVTGLTLNEGHWFNSSGERFALKIQTRSHELLTDLSRSTMLMHPIASGSFLDGSWWAQLPYNDGSEGVEATPDRLYALGVAFKAWQEITPLEGRRLDDKDGLSLFLATSRRFKAYSAMLIAPMIATASEGLPMVPVHADMAVNHNTFWEKDEICGIIDPYATAIAPSGIDLGFAAAKALAQDPTTDLTPLLEGFGSIPERWPLMLEAMCSRTYVDCVVDNNLIGQSNLAEFSNPAIVKFNSN